MTKTQAAALARRARQYGYYASGQDLSDDCPQKCGERITTQRGYGYVPSAKGKPYGEVIDGRPCIYRQLSVTESLDRAVISHLEWCGTDQSVW